MFIFILPTFFNLKTLNNLCENNGNIKHLRIKTEQSKCLVLLMKLKRILYLDFLTFGKYSVTQHRNITLVNRLYIKST